MAERDYTNDPWDDPNYQPPAPYMPTPPARPDDDPYYTQPQQPGIGTPESGYGWGGVDNPAYGAPPAAPAPSAAPAATPGPSQSPTQGDGRVPSSYRPPPSSGINVPPSQLPGDIMSLFNRVPAMTPVQSAYQDALLKYMKRGQETPSLDDPTLAPQVEVFRAGQQRSTERQRLSNAERAAANGQSQSGYLDNLINQGVQQQGFNNASFNANLLGGEMGKRREELQSALQLASATGNQEAARELQARLAQVSAMMQQQALNLQGQLGGGDLALRLMQTAMGNDQFYDQLGINTQLNMENLNQSALQKILSGLNG